VQIPTLETLNLGGSIHMKQDQLSCISYSLTEAKRKSQSALKNLLLRGVISCYDHYEAFFKEFTIIFNPVNDTQNASIGMNLLDISDGNFNHPSIFGVAQLGFSNLCRIFKSINLS
jgi:hypothetical protein